LDREQRDGLEQLIKSGQAPARKLMHARILEFADNSFYLWFIKQVRLNSFKPMQRIILTLQMVFYMGALP
jgi:hypothetical protein